MSRAPDTARMSRGDRRLPSLRPPESRREPESGPPWRGLALNIVRDTAASRIRALGHVDRLRIMEVLARRPANVGEIASALGLSVTVASRHLCELHRAQVVDRTQDGNHAVYALADRDAARLVAVAYAGAATQVRRLVELAAETSAVGAHAR
jgi:DNA-binding transcriptional ArsR family regulator